MCICDKDHRSAETFESLPHDQGGHGRHRCAGCAYDKGYAAGVSREEVIAMNLDALPESQAGTVRHRSPHAAFARGYLDGVEESYSNG